MRHLLLAMAVLPALFVAMPSLTLAQPAQLPQAEVERIVREYLLREPEVIYSALEELQRRRDAEAAARQAAALAANAAEIFARPGDPVASNPTGDVTLVEFLDYKCGYCRSMAPGLHQLTMNDPGLRLVIKEMPILSAESLVAARAALAARRQGRYPETHRALMVAGDLSLPGVIQLARGLGLDADRLVADMADPALQAEIDRNLALARELGITGTPSFALGGQILAGAVPIDDLGRLVAETRRAR